MVEEVVVDESVVMESVMGACDEDGVGGVWLGRVCV